MIDLQAIRKRAADWSVASGWLREDIETLLADRAALEAAHEAELLEFSEFARKRVGDDLMSMTPEEALAAYRAQKEKKDE